MSTQEGSSGKIKRGRGPNETLTPAIWGWLLANRGNGPENKEYTAAQRGKS